MFLVNDRAMLTFIIIFCSSALWPKLPSITLMVFAILVLIFSYTYQLSAILRAGLIAFIWASSVGHYYLYWQIEQQYFEQNTIISGTISTLSSHSFKQTKANSAYDKQSKPTQSKEEVIKIETDTNALFNIKIDTIGKQSLWFKPTVRLSWFAPTLDISQGNKVRLLVKLKPPSGLANPDGFDYHRWLVSKNIAATGYIKESPSNELLVLSPSARQHWISRLSRQNEEYIPWIIALTYGDKRLLSPDDWLLIQQTGTAHLFAISGMHLGIVAGFVLMTLRGALLLIAMRFTLKQINLRYLILLICCFVCCFYAYISGFEVPVLRALMALVLISIALGIHCFWRPISIFLLLICLFLVLFPFSILSVSFWFSFGAVSLILFYVWRYPSNKQNNKRGELAWFSLLRFRIIQMIKLQVFLSLATLPFVMFVYGTLPIVAVPANLFMLPIVTFVLVPCCLILALLILFGLFPSGLLTALNDIVALTINALEYINDFANTSPNLSYFAAHDYAMFALLILLLFLPKWPAKAIWLSAFVLCYVLGQSIWWQHIYFQRETTMYVFDVGQGSAAIIRHKPAGSFRASYAIFDTGGSYRGGFSMAKNVLTPFLAKRKQKQIDFLLLSHLDNDHAGGKDWVSKQYSISNVFAPDSICGRGKNDIWLGQSITVLWPLSPYSGHDNNHSCVVRISNGENSILLTGDIEKHSEHAIVAAYKHTNLLQADVLIAPHHGSNTSSTKEFVAAVQAKHVIFSAGLNNRWGFPKQEVLQRYINSEASTLITGRDGRILIDLETLQVSAYLLDEHKRWYRRP